MSRIELLKRIEKHLNILVERIGARPTGSKANRNAASYIEETFSNCGLKVKKQFFDCLHWPGGRGLLSVDGNTSEVMANPFTPSVHVQGELVVWSSWDDVQNRREQKQDILLVSEDLTGEQLIPTNFPFFTSHEHQLLLASLARAEPGAIIFTSPYDTSYPPVLEDGDCTIPSVTVHKTRGLQLQELEGEEVTLKIQSQTVPSEGCNVLGYRGQGRGKKVVICAHLDTKPQTPGALDNATGIVVLLALAEQLKEKKLLMDLELVAFNGEDYYSSPGQIRYVQDRQEEQEIFAAINIDGCGLKDSKTGWARYSDQEFPLSLNFASSFLELEPWPQGDHMIFAAQNIPTLSLTSQRIFELMRTVIHTPEDTLHRVDREIVADVVLTLDIMLGTE